MTSLRMRDDLVLALHAAGMQASETHLGITVFKHGGGDPLYFATWPEVMAFLIGLQRGKVAAQ